jgi:hypothetical protein
MGDMGDIFNDLKDIRREQRAARSTQAQAMYHDVAAKVDTMTMDASGTWNISKGIYKIQFYPTKGTWQYRGKMMRGGIHSFMNWLDNLG